MRDGVQATLYALTATDRDRTHAILQLVIIVLCYRKLVVKNQTCFLTEQCLLELWMILHVAILILAAPKTLIHTTKPMLQSITYVIIVVED